ncbi:hypothetical protein QTP70_001184 [Hemibagrus guttatus]|uniref:Uncharacterized protein n=1 Tax=Hemibagrus guttatus TaxID=175788 RepID=A0AAE0UL13_9TELE|nr:hypothetical protein QTP70_001184 [Hemibagrus guttatus]
MAGPAAAEPRSARPDQKKPWSTEKSSVGSGAVLEPPALTEAGTEVQGNRMETPDTTPVQGDGGDVDMVDEPVFKVPNKRKKQEHVKGRWKRLVPRMSYRGQMLVINNLAASFLWHKLACVDPPPNLLASIQALLVDNFWDGLHWIPQSVLHMPKEEWGQGLVQLASRTAAFCLQFLQRLLTGPKDLIWRLVAHGLLHKVGGLRLDRTLFLMDTKTLDVSGLPSFYRGLFKIWNCFRKRNKGCGTLHWLLEEPRFTADVWASPV